MFVVCIVAFSAVVSTLLLNRLSYDFLKSRIFARGPWDLNICCGRTDGGGINADIVKHSEGLPNFLLLDDIYQLPFQNKQLKRVLCSHTLEHVDSPERFDRELRRVGQDVHYILPPLWDIGAAFNFLEHKWVFLTFKKEHTRLPRYIRLPFSRTLHRQFKQRIVA